MGNLALLVLASWLMVCVCGGVVGVVVWGCHGPSAGLVLWSCHGVMVWACPGRGAYVRRCVVRASCSLGVVRLLVGLPVAVCRAYLASGVVGRSGVEGHGLLGTCHCGSLRYGLAMDSSGDGHGDLLVYVAWSLSWWWCRPWRE